MDYGADFDATNFQGNTPLHYSVSVGTEAATKVIYFRDGASIVFETFQKLFGVPEAPMLLLSAVLNSC